MADQQLIALVDKSNAALQQSLTIAHESHLAARKSEEDVRVENRKKDERIERLQEEFSNFKSGKGRNNEKQWKKSIQMLEYADDCGVFNDSGVTFSKIILEVIQRGGCCDGVIKLHIPCEYEEENLKKSEKRKATIEYNTAHPKPKKNVAENLAIPKSSKKRKLDEDEKTAELNPFFLSQFLEINSLQPCMTFAQMSEFVWD